MRPLGGTPCFMGQFKKHCSALVLLLNKWKKGGPRWRGRPWPGTGTPHHRVAPYALAMWTFFSPQNMPCPLCWAFYALFSLFEMLSAPLHTSLSFHPHTYLSDSSITYRSQQRPVCPVHCSRTVPDQQQELCISFFEWAHLPEPCSMAI